MAYLITSANEGVRVVKQNVIYLISGKICSNFTFIDS